MKTKFEFIIKTKKMLKQGEFMKKMFLLTTWLSKRYNLRHGNAVFNYWFHDNKNKKYITITISFE